MTVVKAVNKLKALRARRAAREKAFPSAGSHLADPPVAEPQPQRSKSLDENISNPVKYTGVRLATEGIHRQIIVRQNEGQEGGPENVIVAPQPRRMDSAVVLEDSGGEERAETKQNCDGLTIPGVKEREIVHTHSPLDQTIPFLCIGPGKEPVGEQEFMVSESPTGTDEGVYEKAYNKEMERVKGEGKAVETNSTAEDMGTGWK